MDEARASVHAECTPPMSWHLLHVRMLINFLFMYLILLKSAVHRHGRGTRLGTCLVQQQCVSCAVASAACVAANKCCVLFLISLYLLCTGMDEERALVHALCSCSVSPVSSPLVHA